MGKRGLLGIDVGGSKTLCGLFDEKMRLLERIKFKTGPAEGRKRFTHQLLAAIRKLAGTARRHQLKLIAAGAGCAGKVDIRKGILREAPNILCLENYPLARVIRDAAKVPTLLGNDVQVGLYGEYRFGAAQGKKNVIGVFFGTGVGGAAIINGELYRGASGVGGQVGSILTQVIGGPETAESHGILDRMASKAAIGASALGMGAKQWAPHLYREAGTDLSKITWGALARAMRKGDDKIEELIRSRVRVAGIALSSVVNFLNPQMVLLGGGLTEELPKLVLEEVEKGLREYLVPEVGKALEVVVAKLENEAGIYGAALQAMEAFG